MNRIVEGSNNLNVGRKRLFQSKIMICPRLHQLGENSPVLGLDK
nr:MAG TPA: hypothetical protein [Caudoviricetes sp.]